MTDRPAPRIPLVLLPLVSEFTLPADQQGREIRICLRDPERDRWAISFVGQVMDRDGRWRHEPLPSSRSDEFKEATRFGLAEAIEIARAAGLPLPERPRDEREPQSRIEATLDRLRGLVRTGDTGPQLRQALIAMRDLGLPRSDVQVHLERWRAVNDVTDRSEATEEAAMLALDMISGWAPAAAIDWPERD